MFIALPTCGTLAENLFSQSVLEDYNSDVITYVIGYLSNRKDFFSVEKCRIYSDEEFYDLPVFSVLKKKLQTYAVTNAVGALFEANITEEKQPEFVNLCVGMAEDDEYAGEINLEILDLFASHIFSRVIEIETKDGEFFYLVEK